MRGQQGGEVESPTIEQAVGHAVLAAANGDDMRQAELGLFLLSRYPLWPLMTGLSYAVAEALHGRSAANLNSQTAHELADALSKPGAAPLIEGALDIALNEQWPGEDQLLLRTDFGIVMVFVMTMGALAKFGGLVDDDVTRAVQRLAASASGAATLAMELEEGRE